MEINLNIAGHQIALEPGHYVACRPMASRKRQTFPVNIYNYDNDPLRQYPIITISDLTYDQANDFINEFNNGPTSWDGRVIEPTQFYTEPTCAACGSPLRSEDVEAGEDTCPDCIGT